jgi:hypothetical protein
VGREYAAFPVSDAVYLMISASIFRDGVTRSFLAGVDAGGISTAFFVCLCAFIRGCILAQAVVMLFLHEFALYFQGKTYFINFSV